jgi:hypothetical protein
VNGKEKTLSTAELCEGILPHLAKSHIFHLVNIYKKIYLSILLSSLFSLSSPLSLSPSLSLSLSFTSAIGQNKHHISISKHFLSIACCTCEIFSFYQGRCELERERGREGRRD